MSFGVGRHLRAAVRFLLFLLVSIAFATLYLTTLPARRRHQLRVQRWWCQGTAWAAGLRLEAEGEAASGQAPVIFLVNHVSYFDIPAFGSLVDATFVAKSEVANWPLFGQFSRLTGTVFIPRDARRSRAQVELLQRRLARGENLILFPEGTNSDGSDVLPFKSSLLQIAGTAGVSVQPVSLVYTRLVSGEPLRGERRALYAWVDCDDMFPHLWRALGQTGCEVRIQFHPPLATASRPDRKALARAAEQAVRQGVLAQWAKN